MEEKQHWITCFVTDMLLSYIREQLHEEDKIDYAELFDGIEGFEAPADPKTFLSDVKNWIPLAVLRKLELQCEKISQNKDITYHAAKAYFMPGRKQLPSLFEVIIQVLNDVRSALLFANTWGASQTSYLTLQAYETSSNGKELFMLARFDKDAGPTIGAINLVRGFAEGFPRIYPFIDEVSCVEEISQLRLEDVIHEFPQYALTRRGDDVILHKRSTPNPIVTATRACLITERVALDPRYLPTSPDTVVLSPEQGQIDVLTPQWRDERQNTASPAASPYRVITPGVIAAGPLSYSFREGQIFNAPYCRFRVRIKERPVRYEETSVPHLRREVSKLLFEQLRHSKQAQTRMIQMSVEKSRLAAENIRLQQEVQREFSFTGLIGQSKEMQELFGLIRAIAETDVTVLIQGETGTGKELIARAIHYNGARKNKRFVPINCGAIALTLLESELFGHEKGAFTGAISQKKGIFEAADGGTLFLDEIGEISPGTQVKLLRVLQEGEVQRVGGTDNIKVDVRIIAATNQSLEALVEKGTFRQDLYYRLNVFPITVPPLRERATDIPVLVNHFIKKGMEKTHKEVSTVSPPALALLMAYSWPGNIRELENVMQRMMIVCKDTVLDIPDLPPEIRGQARQPKAEARDLKGIARGSAEMIEKRAIQEALAKTRGNVTKAAKTLGISRTTLQNKMKLYDLRTKA